MSDRDEFGAFLIGFIVGGLTGAAVSLLLAPQSGEETRALIKEKAIEIGDKASETYEDAYARAEAAAAEARARAEEWAKIARERADELQRRGQVVLEEQRARLTPSSTRPARVVNRLAILVLPNPAPLPPPPLKADHHLLKPKPHRKGGALVLAVSILSRRQD